MSTTITSRALISALVTWLALFPNSTSGAPNASSAMNESGVLGESQFPKFILEEVATYLTRNGKASLTETKERGSYLLLRLIEQHESYMVDPTGTIKAVLVDTESYRSAMRVKMWSWSHEEECTLLYSACVLACALVPLPGSLACLAFCGEEYVRCLSSKAE